MGKFPSKSTSVLYQFNLTTVQFWQIAFWMIHKTQTRNKYLHINSNIEPNTPLSVLVVITHLLNKNGDQAPVGILLLDGSVILIWWIVGDIFAKILFPLLLELVYYTYKTSTLWLHPLTYVIFNREHNMYMYIYWWNNIIYF